MAAEATGLVPEGQSGGCQAEWARLLMIGFADAGVRDLVASPGSRSTPWLLAALEESRFTCHAVADERSAGFFALGLAKASGRPSLLLCTSGSAAAHYLPALVEAAASYTPLLVLTADRPIELQAGGANQTIDQTKLYGDTVRQFFDLGGADPSPAALRGARRLVAQAYARTLDPEPGPVHLNARARKPLEPLATGAAAELAVKDTVDYLLSRPCPRLSPPLRLPAEPALDRLLRSLAGSRRPMLVAGPGPLEQGRCRAAAHELCRRLGAPFLADSTSQLRYGEERPAGMIDHYGQLLGNPALGLPAPDLLIQLGNPLTTSGYSRFLEQQHAARELPELWVLASWGWRDGDNAAAEILSADLEATLEILLERLPPSRRGGSAAGAWLEGWRRAGRLAGEEIAGLAAEDPLSEGGLARAVAALLPDGAMLAIGNSLPIRQLDGWSRGERGELLVLSQRGASGIDGLVSGAAGAARLLGRPSLLLLGDVSLGHDLSGLELLGRLSTPLVVLVFNNQGGRIFEQLPLASHPAGVGRMDYWTTPHAHDFEGAARHFAVPYQRIESVGQLEAALNDAFFRTGKSILLEARLPPGGAAAQSAELSRRLAARFAAETT
jgi:2-succinyl-5-enolpyruvyl-6-hydroxy-3-cyclohexene-1-carboxylate synthase